MVLSNYTFFPHQGGKAVILICESPLTRRVGHNMHQVTTRLQNQHCIEPVAELHRKAHHPRAVYALCSPWEPLECPWHRGTRAAFLQHFYSSQRCLRDRRGQDRTKAVCTVKQKRCIHTYINKNTLR